MRKTQNEMRYLTGFMATGASATRVAALVWGRDEDGGDLTFKQDDIDLLVCEGCEGCEDCEARGRFDRGLV
jgi:hypothetical protein